MARVTSLLHWLFSLCPSSSSIDAQECARYLKPCGIIYSGWKCSVSIIVCLLPFFLMCPFILSVSLLLAFISCFIYLALLTEKTFLRLIHHTWLVAGSKPVTVIMTSLRVVWSEVAHVYVDPCLCCRHILCMSQKNPVVFACLCHVCSFWHLLSRNVTIISTEFPCLLLITKAYST